MDENKVTGRSKSAREQTDDLIEKQLEELSGTMSKTSESIEEDIGKQVSALADGKDLQDVMPQAADDTETDSENADFPENDEYESDSDESEPEEQDQFDQTKGKSRKALKAGLITLGVLVVCLLIAYGTGVIYYSSHFYSQTTINNMNFSGQTVAEVETALTEEVDSYYLILQERENITEKITGSEIGLEVVFDGSFEELLKKQNAFLWFVGLFKKSDYTVGSAIVYDEEMLDEKIASLNASDELLMITPIDASIEWSETDSSYYIEPGTEGTQLDTEAFDSAIVSAVENLEDTLNLAEAGCYIEQNVSEDDEQLTTALTQLNTYCKSVITYDFEGTTETCTAETIRTWLTLGEDYTVTISSELAREYIDTLGDKYNTYGTTRNFTTTQGSTIEITLGDYGWRLNREDMTTALVAAVQEGKEQQLEVLWLQTANSMSEEDWGDTYVEVNMGTQHLYFYVDGQLVVESDIVSGKMTSDRMTPEGIYSLKYKEKNRTLRGSLQSDGSYEYESFVNFWMPFNGGIGLHDASWRSSFGGTIYVNSGSHGCINLPYSAAKTIYENIVAGTPIICFYGSGTSTTTTTTTTVADDTADDTDAGTSADTTETTAETTEDTAVSTADTGSDDTSSATVTDTDTTVATATETPVVTEAPAAQATGEAASDTVTDTSTETVQE